MQAITDWSRPLRVQVRGDDVAQHAGCVLPRMLADRVGLTSALSAAISRPEVVHDRGAVLRDVAVVIAGGGRDISDVRVLGEQERLFGEVASTSTVWRALNELDPDDLAAITVARSRARARVWDLVAARHDCIPPARTSYDDLGDQVVVRLDASLIGTHSDKQEAAGTFKGGFGFHPLMAWCDNTSELLAILPRAGNSGSNTAADHIQVVDAAIAAIPARWRRNLLITCDGAGSTHELLDHLTGLDAREGWSVQYSVGFDLDTRVRTALAALPETAWQPALDPTGRARDDGAAVAEVTGLLRESVGGDRLDRWPADMRVLVRREPIVHGTQLSLFEQTNGYRYQPFATNTPAGQPQRLEARHRVHARVESCIRTGKDTGLAHWPSHSWSINHAWVTAAAIAIDLLAWTRLLLLHGRLATAEPSTLRHRLLHTAARLVSHSRQLVLRIPETWPWAHDLAAAFARVRAIP